MSAPPIAVLRVYNQFERRCVKNGRNPRPAPTPDIYRLNALAAIPLRFIAEREIYLNTCNLPRIVFD